MAARKPRKPTLTAAVQARREAEDLGFRVFKAAASYFHPAGGLTAGWDAAGVVWEVALLLGLTPTAKLGNWTAPNGNVVWEVHCETSGRSFAACLDATVRHDLTDGYGWPEGRTLVVRRSAVDDTTLGHLRKRWAVWALRDVPPA
jgi:hypothetical protein